MADLRALNRIKNQIEILYSEVEREIATMELRTAKTKNIFLEDQWKEYKDELRIVVINATTNPIMDAIENTYFKTKRILVEFIQNQQPDTPPSAEPSLFQGLIDHQKSFLDQMSYCTRAANPEQPFLLPKCNIPTFDGNYSEFSSFQELFQEGVINQKGLTDIERLQYLKSSLKGEPASLIRHIPLSKENFKLAWDVIVTRYEKKRRTLTALIKRFFEQPSFHQTSSKALYHMADTILEVTSGLHQLGPEAETRDPWLLRILLDKVDSDTKKAWQFEVSKKDFPTLNDFSMFLQGRGDAVEGDETTNKKTTSIRPKSSLSVHHSKVAPVECPKCQQSHWLYQCSSFKKLDPTERRAFVAKAKLCFNCLKSNHRAPECWSKYRCAQCHQPHHTTLHLNTENTNLPISKVNTVETKPTDNTSTSTNDPTLVLHAHSSITSNFQALLPTAVIKIKNGFGIDQPCRALLDSGAQASFISESCVQRLQLNRRNARISIQGLSPNTATTRGVVTLDVGSYYSNSRIPIEALILNNLPSILPNYAISLTPINQGNLRLADPQYGTPRGIDLIIGANKFFELLESGKIVYDENKIIAQNSLFGWVLSGALENNQQSSTNNNVLSCHTLTNIDESLKQFWELEEVIFTKHQYTAEEQYCEENFQETHIRDDEGRFIVEIPFKNYPPVLGNSFNIALKRFNCLERKLEQSKYSKEEYVTTMREYLANGYLEEIIESDQTHNYYLPHHAVYKFTDNRSKLRVVYDGSCKSSNGMSLNENMFVGPTIQPTLWEILLRFRLNKIAMVADIEKMYLQVKLNQPHQNYQRILWRESPNAKLKHYRLTRVTFGLSSSPFLAIRSLQQIGTDLPENEKLLKTIIKSDFYVDDLISGTNDIIYKPGNRIKT